MNKKRSITIAATCVLLGSMIIPSAMAAARTSTANVGLNTTSSVSGTAKTLANVGIYGSVTSSSSSTGTAMMTGDMMTKGNVFHVSRGTKSVSPKQSLNFSKWGNPNAETGTFYAKAVAPSGNHKGNCIVNQD